MIDKITARKIASEWHGGQASALYSFASFSGELPVENLWLALVEVRREILLYESGDPTDSEYAEQTERELNQLKEYLTEELRLHGK